MSFFERGRGRGGVRYRDKGNVNIVNAFPAEEERYHHFDVNRADSSVLRDRYGLHAGDGPNPTDWRFRHRGDRAKSKERDRSRSPFSDRPEQLGRVSPTYHESIRITVGNDQYCDAERPSKEDKLGLSVYDSDSTPPGSPGRRMPPKFLPRNLDSIDTRGPREFRQKDSYQAKVDNFIKECEEKLRSSGEKSFGSVAGSVYSSGEEKQLNRARQERFIRENWILEKAKEWQTEIEIEDKMKGKKSKEKDLALLKDHEEKSEKSSKKKEKFLKSSRDLEDFISKERYGASHQGGEIFEKTFSYDKSRYLDEGFQSWKKCEHDSVPQTLSSPISFSLARPHSPDKLAKPRKSILKNKDIFSGVAGTVSSHEKLQKNSFVLPGLDLIDVDDEEKFLYGDDSGVTSAVSSGFEPPKKMLSSATDSKGDMWQSINNVLKDQTTLSHSSAECQLSTNEQKSMFEKAPMSSPLLSKHDPTIENILKSIGFDFEMSKRMQERAKQVQQPLKNLNQPQNSQFGINQSASFLSGGLVNVDIKPDFFKNKKKRMEGLENQHNGKKPKLHLEETEHLSKTEECESVQRGFSQPVSHSQAMQFSIPQIPSHSLLTLPPFTRVEHRSFPSPHFTQPGSRVFDQHCCFPVPVSHDSYYNFETDIPVSSAAKGGLVNSNLKVITLQEENPENEQLKDPVKCLSSSLSKGDPSGRKEVSPKLEEIKRTIEVKPISKPDHEKTILMQNEVDKLIKERYDRITKVESLTREVENLRKQQNNMMRKKQRQKDGHKDPVLIENAKLQDEISEQISKLKKMIEDNTSFLESAGIEVEPFPAPPAWSKKSHAHSISKKKGMAFPKPNQEFAPKEPVLLKKDQLPPRKDFPQSKAGGMSQKEKVPQKEERSAARKDWGPLSKEHPREQSRERSPSRKESLQPRKDWSKERSPLRSKWMQKQERPSLQKEQTKRRSPPRKDRSSPCREETPPQKEHSPPGEEHLIKQRSESSEAEQKSTNGNLPAKESKRTVSAGMKKIRFEYFDPGNHWCRLCNHISGNVFEVFQHLQSKKHQQKLDHYDRPWLPESIKNPSNKPKIGPVQLAPIKGVEFLMSTIAFYCSICHEFSGDVLSADAHLKSEVHNEKYQKYIEENPFYEKRYNLDKAAGLSMYPCDLKEKKRCEESDEEIQEDNKKKKKVRPVENTDAINDSKLEIEREIKIEIKSENLPDIKKEPKEMGEMGTENEEAKRASGFGRFTWSKGDEVVSDEEKVVEAPSVEQKPPEPAKTGKIAIKLTGKTGIKPVPRPVLSPWTAVSGKSTKTAPTPAKVEKFPLRKQTKREPEVPPSLDMFLSIEGKTSKKNIPVLMDIKDIPLPDKKKLTKQVIADAFSGKIKDDLPVSKTVDKGIAKPVSKERTVTTSMHSPPPPPPPLPSASVTKAAYMLRPPPPPPPPPLLSSLAEQKPETTPVLLLPDIKEQQEQANLEKNMVLCQIQPKAEVAGMENPVEGPQLPEKQSQLDSPIFEQSSELPLPKNNLKAEENVQPMQKESNDKSSMNSEDLEDMKMLGIDPTASIPIAIPKPPPPISCNASWQNSDCMATSSGSDLYSIFFKRQKQNLDGYELLNIASEDAIKNVRLIVDEIVDRTIEDLEETFLVKTEMQSSPDAANMSTESSENGTSEFESTSMQEEETKIEDVCSYAKSQAEASTSLDNSEQISSRVESRENCVSEQTGQEEINLVNAVTESFVTPVTDRWVDTGVSSVLTASSKDQENMPVQESEETNIITAVYESKTDGEARNFSSGEVAITPENSTEQEVSIVLVGCQDLLPSEYQKREIKIVSLADKVPTQITCSQWEDTNQQETLEAEEKETASALSSEKDGKVIDTTEFLNSEECQLMDCNTNTNSNFVMPILQNELKDSTLQEYATSDEIMPPDLSQEADAAASSDAGAEAMDASQPATDDDTPVQLSANFVSSSFDVVLEPSKFYVSSGEHELMMKSETEDFLLTPIVQVSEYSSCVTSSTVSITFTEPKLKATSLFLASAPEMFSEQPSTIDGSYLHISGPKAAMYTANLESPTQTLQINHPEKILLNQKTSVAGPTTDLENPFGKSSPNTLLRNEKNVESSSDVVLSSLSAHNLTGKSGSQESSVAEHLDADSGEIMLDKMASSTGFENLGSCNFPEFQLCLSKFPTADKDLHDKNAEALYGKAVTSASFENLNRSIQHCESGEHPPHVVSSKDQLETDSTLQPRQLSICNQIPNCGIERVSAPRITLEWEKRPSDKTDTETYVRINEMTIAHATELQTSALLDDKEAATTIHETEMLLCSLESPEPACLGSNCFRVSGIDTTLGIPSAEPSHSLPRECDEQSSCVKSKIYLLQQNTNDASSNEVSLLETTVKNVDAVPKMLMPCVILHDIRYTVSGSLSPEDSISLTNLDPLSTGETGISEENGSSSMIESLKDSLEANMHGEVIQIFPENVAQENNASIGVGSESIAVGTEGSFFKDVLAGPTCIGSILPVTAVVDDHEAMLQSQVCSDPSRNNSPESVQVCNEENLEGKNTSNSVSDNSFAAEIHPEVNELINMNEDLH